MFVTTVSSLREAAALVSQRFDAALVEVDQAVDAVQQWAAIKNLAAANEALAAARVAQTNVAVLAGDKSTAHWLARHTGTTANQARVVIATGERLRSLGSTTARAKAGSLSAAQTEVISIAATANPSVEDDLLNRAEKMSLGELRQECARIRAAADPSPKQTEERIHKERCVRRWTDAEGAGRLSVTGPVDVMARFDTAIAPIVERLFNEARRAGTPEDPQAYAFDAFAELIDRATTTANTGDSQTTNKKRRVDPKFLALLHLDVEAMIRGELDDGERCEIPGLGPISVDKARDLLGESILKLVITRGQDVATTVHLGRGPNAAQKLALLWTSPTCTRLGCDRRGHLEADHNNPWVAVHETTLANLDHLCKHEHDLKTRFGWSLIEGTGKREFVPPDDPRHPKNKPREHSPPAA